LLAVISLLYIPVQKGLERDRMSIASLEEELSRIKSVKWTLSSLNVFLVIRDIRRFRRDGLTDTQIWARFKCNHPSYERVCCQGITDESLIKILDLEVMGEWTLRNALNEIKREKEIPREIVALTKLVQRRLRVRFALNLMLMAMLIIGSGITLVLGLERDVWLGNTAQKKLFRAALTVSALAFLVLFLAACLKGICLQGAWSGILFAGGIWVFYFGARYALIRLKPRQSEKPKARELRMKE
jgi:hypothetical protein